MAEDQDPSSKTEEPTQKRLDDAHQKGQIAHSQEINHWFMIGAAALGVSMLAAPTANRFTTHMVAFLEHPEDLPMEIDAMGSLLAAMAWSFGQILFPILLLFIGAALAGNIVQHPISLAAERIKPKFSKLSPLNGIKRIFSIRGLTDFSKNLLKLMIIGGVASYLVWPAFAHLGDLIGSELIVTALLMRGLTIKLLLGVVAVLSVIAGADFLYQRWDFIKGLRMSRQELKDELKQSEGDPQIKGRIRQLRINRARKRMMAAIPTADVVITNPTHFAVALKYETEKMAAPRVVAKGADLIALAIRKLAEEKKVPLVENPPLARALYAACEIDQEVPVEHYKAVAEIIGYVFKLKGKMFGGPARRSRG